MMIDAHCHAGPGDGFEGPWAADAPLDVYLRRATTAGIQRVVVFGAFHSDSQRCNQAVAQLAQKYSPRLIPFVFVHAERDRGKVELLVRPLVLRAGFQGIKVHRHQARLSREICEVARKYHLPVLYDVAGDVASIDLFAPLYPTVPFIIPHLGSFAGDWRAHAGMAERLVRWPNVYTDTSGVRHFDYLVEVVKRAGAGKVIFGSDGPWLHPGVELYKIKALGLPASQASLIMGKTIHRLLPRHVPVDSSAIVATSGL